MAKKLAAILAAVLVLAVVFAGCSSGGDSAPSESASESPAAASESASESSAASDASESPAAASDDASDKTDGGGKPLTIGYLGWDLGADWNKYTFAGLEWGAEMKNCEIISTDAKLDAEAQISNAESLISQGVDALVMFPVTPDSGLTIVRMANEAGIPIVIENTFLDDSGVDIVGQVACEYGNIGYAAIEWAANNVEDAKLLYVHGGSGEGVYEAYKVGVDQALEDFADKVEMVGLIDGEWQSDPSYKVTQDFITAGTADFNVVFANNDEQAKGVYKALQEAGMEDIPIISTGGSPEGYEMLEAGQEAANMTAPANLQGLIAFGKVWANANGGSFGESKVPLPVIPVDDSNKGEWIFWDDMDAGYEYVSANVGPYEP